VLLVSRGWYFVEKAHLQSIQERRLARIVLRLSSAPLPETYAEAPALTRPRIRIRVSFFAQISPWNLDTKPPIVRAARARALRGALVLPQGTGRGRVRRVSQR
jgi:hypothetical protein